jgi:two-component system phosphate regulon sensor histidine kinase PhoR
MEDPRAYEELRVAFTAAVSHELRTPLARLLALLETAGLPGTDTAELLDQARAEVEEMRALVDDILFLSELESGREVVSLGSTAALPVFEEVADGLSDRAVHADVEVVLDVQPDTRLPLRRRMLQVVLENLADNAIRYAGTRSTLTLRARPGLLEVEDDGTGVDEAEVPRLFERFYRGDRARASRGTGLGLAIVKHVVTAAGGQVEASTGPGLRITCSFPVS